MGSASQSRASLGSAQRGASPSPSLSHSHSLQHSASHDDLLEAIGTVFGGAGAAGHGEGGRVASAAREQKSGVARAVPLPPPGANAAGPSLAGDSMSGSGSVSGEGDPDGIHGDPDDGHADDDEMLAIGLATGMDMGIPLPPRHGHRKNASPGPGPSHRGLAPPPGVLESTSLASMHSAGRHSQASLLSESSVGSMGSTGSSASRRRRKRGAQRGSGKDSQALRSGLPPALSRGDSHMDDDGSHSVAAHSHGSRGPSPLPGLEPVWDDGAMMTEDGLPEPLPTRERRDSRDPDGEDADIDLGVVSFSWQP